MYVRHNDSSKIVRQNQLKSNWVLNEIILQFICPNTEK